MFEPLFSPGDINENLLHRAGGGLEEMPAIGEVFVAVPGNLQPDLVYECCGLQGLSGFFIGHSDDGEFAQFLIDEREQLLCGLGIALLKGIEDLGDFAHAAHPTDHH